MKGNVTMTDTVREKNNIHRKPNFILVMTDQQRADIRASRGFCLDTMPFLDAWAKGGCDFINSYTPNPICMAARVSLFTGRTSESHKVRTNHNRMDVTYTKDLLDILKENGYITALCGKNHSHRSPSDFDFAKTNGHLGYEDETNSTPEEIAFADYLRSTNHMEKDEPSPGGVTVQFPYRNVRDTFEFIDSLQKDQPFFVWLSMAEPHNPSQVPEPYFDMFPPESLPAITGKEALAGKSRRFKILRSVWEEVLGDKIDYRISRTRSNYYGMLRLIDDQFARLIKGVEERGLADSTYVIYLSDHGDFVGEYGLLRKGGDLCNLMTNIPTVWRGPQVKPQVSNSYISLIDFFPTLCEIIGADIPDGVQGKSMLSLLKGDTTYENEFDCAYMEGGYGGLMWDTDEDALTLEAEGTCDKNRTRFDCLNTWTQCGTVRAVCKNGYKLQLDSCGEGFLYNLKNDPLELNNLWDSTEHSEIKVQMLSCLAEQMMQHCDPLPYPHNRYRVKKHPLGYRNTKYISKDCGVSPLKSYRGHNLENK